MKRTTIQTIGEVIDRFYLENPELKQRILELRAVHAWKEILGPMVAQTTRELYVKNGVLYVSLTSAVLRSELVLHKARLLKALNEQAGGDILHDLVIR